MPRRKFDPMALRADLLAFALGFPSAYEDDPWGEVVVKVNKKIFVFLGMGDEQSAPGMSVKLPESAPAALELPGVTPTGYGLGRAGWVSVSFTPAADAELFREWVDESYRAVALKRLIKLLDT
jgi:predicted DNA-binding protein (MmcQ/YjbR family)